MKVFRVEKTKYLSTLLDGIGGRDHDFRWNTKGHPIIYASESRSLALHEKAGNMSRPFFGLPSIFCIAVITLPDGPYEKIRAEDLPAGWDRIDRYHPATQDLGDNFTVSDELALFVPSTIVKGEYNVLINPKEAGKMHLSIHTEHIDPRLLEARP